MLKVFSYLVLVLFEQELKKYSHYLLTNNVNNLHTFFITTLQDNFHFNVGTTLSKNSQETLDILLKFMPMGQANSDGKFPSIYDRRGKYRYDKVAQVSVTDLLTLRNILQGHLENQRDGALVAQREVDYFNEMLQELETYLDIHGFSK